MHYRQMDGWLDQRMEGQTNGPTDAGTCLTVKDPFHKAESPKNNPEIKTILKTKWNTFDNYLCKNILQKNFLKFQQVYKVSILGPC